MGNRGVVVFVDAKGTEEEIGVYLHWNGGVESVQAFLDVTRERVGHVNLVGFVQTVANYFCYDGNSLYVGKVANLDTDNGDNGTFYVDREGKILRREHAGDWPSAWTGNAYYRGVRANCRAMQGPRTVRGGDLDMEHELDRVLAKGLKAMGAATEGK